MNDLAHAGTLFVIFGIALVIYGAVLTQTGNIELLPWRAQHSIRGPEDVRRVGRITLIVGVVIGVIALLVRLLATGIA